MYNHYNQFRCIIIRGKSQRELDNLLPTYALVVDTVCPCKKEDFEKNFNRELVKLLYKNGAETHSLKKTLDNHRTEIAGKLFGLYYLSRDGYYYASTRTVKYLADNDQPAFFKDICYKFQFPNGMNKINILEEQMEYRISIRQFPYIVKCLQVAEELHLDLTVSDIGYYILNALDVLTGKASVDEVVRQIKSDKDQGIVRRIKIPEGKQSSFSMQHIREQLNLLELANIIFYEDKVVRLNHREQKALDLFSDKCGVKPDFDVYTYNLNEKEERDNFYLDWNEYYSKISDCSDLFRTEISALIDDVDIRNNDVSSSSSEPEASQNYKILLGDEGEQFVYKYEKDRVASFSSRLALKVLLLGKTKGLGYDIQSVVAEEGEFAEFVKYIEVKATKRLTAPNIDDETWVDSLNITRNEWVAAMQHKEYYSIYRVYFVRDKVIVFILNDIYKKEHDKKIKVIPITYRVDFNKDAVDEVLS